MSETYYLIWNEVLGKEENGSYYIYRDGTWVPDKESIIRDRLIGYDPFEPPGSPYGIGNGSVMAEMDEITYEEAKKIMGERI